MIWSGKIPSDVLDSIRREFEGDEELLSLLEQEDKHTEFGITLALRAEDPAFTRVGAAGFLQELAEHGLDALVKKAETSVRRKQIWGAFVKLRIPPD